MFFIRGCFGDIVDAHPEGEGGDNLHGIEIVDQYLRVEVQNYFN